jgi:hypothetical protein
MKKHFFLIAFLLISMLIQAVEIRKLNCELLNNSGSFWIGAIRADSAHIPAGKRFPSSEMGKPEYKAIWKNINPVSKRSILLRKSFSAQKEIKEAITSICGLGHYVLTISGKGHHLKKLAFNVINGIFSIYLLFYIIHFKTPLINHKQTLGQK